MISKCCDKYFMTSIIIDLSRFIKEGHAEINELKTSVSELRDGFSNLEIAFKKVSQTMIIYV